MELARNSSSAVTILFVEDDHDTMEILQILMARKFPDVRIHQAENGELGVSLCRENVFDIVITDINLPGIDGICMAREIKSMKPDTKFIVLSGYNEKSYLNKLDDLGITDFMVKPIDTNILFKLIENRVKQVLRERYNPSLLIH
ncbi:response regulator transcription factor [Geomobilimonas luticola]|uniref:Response regulator n=1 Tax=Geomobilimonas luticola TaxID=1114878 RepID=A0ABS5SBY1_9BACT|nr:response regulator [Geomobilimonas luticola]MBT0652871.1 response regulator [Geomobilimonas luticola]